MEYALGSHITQAEYFIVMRLFHAANIFKLCNCVVSVVHLCEIIELGINLIRFSHLLFLF